MANDSEGAGNPSQTHFRFDSIAGSPNLGNSLEEMQMPGANTQRPMDKVVLFWKPASAGLLMVIAAQWANAIFFAKPQVISPAIDKSYKLDILINGRHASLIACSPGAFRLTPMS